MDEDRSSQPQDVNEFQDPREIALAEAENSLRQFDAAMGELDKWISDSNYKFRPSLILTLNRIVLRNISRYAGVFRPGDMKITGSDHQPPTGEEVPAAVEEFCEFIESNFETQSAVFLSAYALWKLNWIHPFVDGNGRTSRIVSYLILCAKLGYRVNGTNTVPDQISSKKAPYYKALEAADKAHQKGKIDVSELEDMLDGMLAAQLLSVHKDAIDKGFMRIETPTEIIEENEKVGSGFVVHLKEYVGIYSFLLTIIAVIVAVIGIIIAS